MGEKIIKFHKKFYLRMLIGDKTQTMRRSDRRFDVQEGDVVRAVFPGFENTLLIKILKIGYKQMKSITEKDAILEGYESKNDFITDLYSFYPNLNMWDRLYYYKFELI